MRACWIFIVGIVVSSMFSTGCATILRGNRQTVEVLTEPDGATVNVDGKIFTTPAKVLIHRKKSYDVLVTKEGYQGIRFMLHPRWDAGGAGAVAMDAIVPGGSVMFIIDTLSGADREFNKIATIKLPPTTVPTTQIITLYERKGVLMSKAEYDEAVARDKWFGSKKMPTTTQASKRPAVVPPSKFR